MRRVAHQPPNGDMVSIGVSVESRVDEGGADLRGDYLNKESTGLPAEHHERALQDVFGSLEQRQNGRALMAEVVTARLAPQLQRIEQMVQDLHQHQRQVENITCCSNGMPLCSSMMSQKAELVEEHTQFVDSESVLSSRRPVALAKGDEQVSDKLSSEEDDCAIEANPASPSSRCGSSPDAKAKAKVCVCGNTFASDAVFCRQCGRARKAVQNSRTPHQRRMTSHGYLVEEAPSIPVEPERTSPFARFVLSHAVERCFFLVIMVNVGVSVVRANRMAKTLNHDTTGTEQIIEIICILVFTVELILKMAVHGLFFFINTDMWWNMFDFFIVVTSIIEQLLLFLGTGGASLMFMRIYRVIRACKVLRVVRAFRFLDDLRVMADCVMGSMMPLLWSCVLLLIVTLIFAMCFMQVVTEHRIDQPGICVDDPWGEFWCEDIQNSFNSVQAAMLSLFMATTGGRDWGEVFWLVSKAGLFPQILFCLFIVFFTFAFFNIVTAIFLDRAMQKATPDREEAMLRRKRDDHKAASDLKILIEKMDKDGLGIITEAEISNFEKDPLVLDSLEFAGLNVMDMHQFFDTLCKTSGATELDIDTFVEAAFQMKGVASAIDVQTLLFQMQDVQKALSRMEQKVENNGKATQDVMTKTAAVLPGPRPFKIQDRGRSSSPAKIRDAPSVLRL